MTTVTSLQQAVAAVSANIQRTNVPALEAQINKFTLEVAPAHYGYTAYLDDMEGLSNYAIQYLSLVQSKSNPISVADSNTILQQLKAAADASQRRTEGLKALRDPFFDVHYKAPENFKNLVDYLVRHQEYPLSDDEVVCYLAAFPNWEYHITHVPSDSPNSQHCQALIKVGPA